MTQPPELKAKLAPLGISEQHIAACRLPPFAQADDLVDAADDMFGRPALMTPGTLTCWRDMTDAARRDGIELLLVSAFRSIDYQCELIARKLAKGQDLDTILTVNAIPGFSEHHTGRAIDLTCEDCEPLTEEFEFTDAFSWLCHHAARFHFAMSFPRDNALGIIYEPWHWACEEED